MPRTSTDHAQCFLIAMLVFSTWPEQNSRGRWLGHGLDGQRTVVRFLAGNKRFFCFSQRPGRLWSPPSLLFNGHRGSFAGVKRLGRDVEDQPPSDAEVKNEWSYTSTPICMRGVDRQFYIFYRSLKILIALDLTTAERRAIMPCCFTWNDSVHCASHDSTRRNVTAPLFRSIVV